MNAIRPADKVVLYFALKSYPIIEYIVSLIVYITLSTLSLLAPQANNTYVTSLLLFLHITSMCKGVLACIK